MQLGATMSCRFAGFSKPAAVGVEGESVGICAREAIPKVNDSVHWVKRRRGRRVMNKEAKQLISEDELRRRKEAIDYARASIGLGGFAPSPAAEHQAERFINGEIDMQEFMREILAICERK